MRNDLLYIFLKINIVLNLLEFFFILTSEVEATYYFKFTKYLIFYTPFSIHHHNNNNNDNESCFFIFYQHGLVILRKLSERLTFTSC